MRVSEWPTVVAGLGGTALGALVTGGLAWTRDKSRWRRDDRTRWIELRRDLAVRCLEATADVVTWSVATNSFLRLEAAGRGGFHPSVRGVSSAHDALQKWGESDARVHEVLLEIDLVGTEEERAAATQLREAAWGLASSGHPSPGQQEATETTEKYRAAAAAYDVARAHFRQTVRKSLAPS